MKRLNVLILSLGLGLASALTPLEPSQAKGENLLGHILDIVMDLAYDELGGENSNEDTDSYKVVRVVDGDTIIVEMDGKEERVRLIGVDCPESVHPDKDKNTKFGKIASEFTKSSLEGRTVSLEFDQEKTDRYDRLLAYVYIDGEMFNETLLKEGMAKAKAYPPNTKYKDNFDALEEEAKANDKGLWAIENMDKDSLSYKIMQILEKALELLGLVKDLISA